MIKDWIEIKATGPRADKDSAIQKLIEAGSPGVEEVEEAPPAVGTLESFSQWEGELPAFTEPLDATAVLKAYLPKESALKTAGLFAGLSRLGWHLAASDYRDRDWSHSWKASIKPVKVTHKGSSVTVKPTWRSVRKKSGDIVIDIDPGMAFGTGGHATTRMCLKAITTLMRGPERRGLLAGMLDVGTGTGVLAIAAMKLGARKAVGTEIDPVAAKIARKNVSLNSARVLITVRPVEKIPGRFPLVVANILAGDLMRMSKALSAKVADNGYLILSGILTHETETVKAAFRPHGLTETKGYSSGEWAATVLKKKIR